MLAVILLQVFRTATDPANGSAQYYVPAATTSAVVLFLALGLPSLLTSFAVGTSRALPWIVGLASILAAGLPWLFIRMGSNSAASWVYAGTHVPQGQVQFWDLGLVLQSLDCDKWGFDVFVANNGCLTDAAIYGPGVLWLNRLPLSLFSASHVQVLGVAAILLSSLSLVWLARMSAGIGRIALLACALGAPWLLLLERGNIDAALIWVAVLVVFAIRRWDRLWVWFAAAALIWLVGTWKYYPFALGLMLIPALRLRRGWTVLVAFGAATLGYLIVTWSNFRFSSQSNSNMINLGDVVVLGRVPVVARMIGTQVGAAGFQFGDVLVALLALAALAWGIGFGLAFRRPRMDASMLGIGGSSIFLAAILVAGFGWAYKAAFLVLCIPAVAISAAGSRMRTYSSISILILIVICGVVVWNTLLATSAGVIAASFVFGCSAVGLSRLVLQSRAQGNTRQSV